MVLLYTADTAPRLQYIVDFFSRELFDTPVRITTSIDEFRNSALPKINYSSLQSTPDELHIEPHGLLFETGIRKQQIECFELNFSKVFFQTGGDLPFDIFSASFYLISRYEEYLSSTNDRYDAKKSLAYKENFLHLPLVNIWIEDFKKALQQKFPDIRFRRKTFKGIVTYNIVTPYRFLNQGLMNTMKGFSSSVINGRWKELVSRWKVIRRKEKDPYDCFEWLDALHLYCRSKPYYVFLASGDPGEDERGNSTPSNVLHDLIEYYSATYKTGVLASQKNDRDPTKFMEEVEWMSVVADRPIIHSRQYLNKLSFPHTYRHIMNAGVEKDFSIGYEYFNGFRASVSSSFFWYDLAAERTTEFVVYPFCFSDKAFLSQQYTPGNAYTELLKGYELVKKLKGLFITAWHNDMLGNQESNGEWKAMFELFMKETLFWDAYSGDD